MRLLGALGGLDDDEIRATFNGGLGMVVVVAPDAVDATIGRSAASGDRARPSSARSCRVDRLDGARYAEGALGVSGRIAVAVSGAGSNLRALHAAAERGELGGEIVLVVADRPCPALDWAAEQGIDTASSPAATDDCARRRSLGGARPDVVVLAGYMRIVGPLVLAAYAGPDPQHPPVAPARVPGRPRRPRRARRGRRR